MKGDVVHNMCPVVAVYQRIFNLLIQIWTTGSQYIYWAWALRNEGALNFVRFFSVPVCTYLKIKKCEYLFLEYNDVVQVKDEDKDNDGDAAADDVERRSAVNEDNSDDDDDDAAANDIQQLNGLLNECITLLRSVTNAREQHIFVHYHHHYLVRLLHQEHRCITVS